VITFSGCPGESEHSRHPSWVACWLERRRQTGACRLDCRRTDPLQARTRPPRPVVELRRRLDRGLRHGPGRVSVLRTDDHSRRQSRHGQLR
jgi:hypothetical protein